MLHIASRISHPNVFMGDPFFLLPRYPKAALIAPTSIGSPRAVPVPWPELGEGWDCDPRIHGESIRRKQKIIYIHIPPPPRARESLYTFELLEKKKFA